MVQSPPHVAKQRQINGDAPGRMRRGDAPGGTFKKVPPGPPQNFWEKDITTDGMLAKTPSVFFLFARCVKLGFMGEKALSVSLRLPPLPK